MELEKVVNIDLDEQPIDTAISNKNIAFYNLDKNTAKFQFLVTNRKRPLLVSKENVKGYAFFKSSNGSTSGVLELEFLQPLKGVLGVTLPNYFLKASTDSMVYGELYLSLNDASGSGQDDTVVLGRFSFSVKDALVNRIESDIKVRYIRMFDDLNDEIKEKIQSLKTDVENINEIVESVQDVGEQANTTITKTKNDGITEINTVTTSSISNIQTTRDSALNDLIAKESDVSSAYDVALSKFNVNAEDVTTEFNKTTSGVNQVIDDKMTEFNDNLAKNNFVTNENLTQTLDGMNWQKYKLTESNGGAVYLSFEDKTEADLLALDVGLYYVTRITIDAPVSSSSGFVKVIKRSDDVVKHIEFRPYNSTEIWQNRFYDTWGGWQRIDSNTSDTDWILLDFINGAVVNNAKIDGDDTGFVSAYRIMEDKGVKKLLLRLNGSNIQPGQIIAQIPSGTVPSQQKGFLSTANENGFAIATVRTNGQININIPVPNIANWKVTQTNWIYGQLEFTI